MRLRIKDFTTKVGSGVTPKGGAEVYQTSGIPLFRSQNVTDDGFLLDDIAYISQDIDNMMQGSRVKADDVLLNITGASIGRCYYTPSTFKGGNVNQHVCIIRPKKSSVLPKYLHYCLISPIGKELIKLSQNGANREGLTIEDIKNFAFNIPSITEQDKIITYLDKKVKNINSQISLLTKKQEHYLRLKKSLINRTVCHGLNPNVQMKDSGIRIIGMIPEHWQIKRIKDIGELKLGKMLTSKYQEGLTLKPYLKARNIGWGKIILDNLDKMYFSKPELFSLKVKKNDLLFTEGGEVGKTCIWNNEIPECYIQNSVQKLTVNKDYEARYYLYMSIFYGNIKFYDSIVNLVSIKHLTHEKLLNVKILMPPLAEQEAIANYLDDKCSKIDTIVEKISEEINLLGKLKKSLINEVITGKRTV